MTVPIEIRELREIQLRGGVLIDCISAPNHENSRVGLYLIDELNMEQIAIIDSEVFPCVSSIIERKPHFPMRVYANQSSKTAVIVSDFVPGPVCERSLGKSIINWAKSKSISLVITSFQISSYAMPVDIGAACSTQSAQIRLEQSRIDQVNNVRLTGLPAILLNEGYWLNMDVISLVLQDQPSEALHKTNLTERIVQGIDVLLPDIKFDLRKLYNGNVQSFSLEIDREPSRAQNP